MSTPHDVPTHQLSNPDQYITRVGKILRKTSLDELPQIWDIFIGNMSIIGPRPALWNQQDLVAERDKYKANDLTPGLTGWAQINGRDELKIPVKAQLDGEYVIAEHSNSFEAMGIDFKCFLKSIISVLHGDGVVEGEIGEISKKIIINGELCSEVNDISSSTEVPRFSVLMSVYKKDEPEYLSLALKSIYDDQIRKPDEIVVVFDGPLSHELLDVLEKFREGKEDIVKYYPQKINRGLGEALRIGSEKCTGEYILRMDADDISASDRFEKQITYVLKHPEVGAVGTDIAEFQNDLLENKMRVRSCPKNHVDIVNMCKKRNPMNHVSVCIKKEELKRCGGYKSLLLLEDYYLWIRMISNGSKLANINESLVYVRVGNGFDSKRGSRTRIDGWRYLQKYMINNRMIRKSEGIINMININVFVKSPVWIKKIAYEKVLRK